MNNPVLLILSLISILSLSCNNGNTNAHGGDHQYTNALVQESSPYLLQHAHNPVNWYPWKQEALDKAKNEDKLLLISIGYAACHWCHVMEHESFEDTTVANVMNANFVNIKVDREERPDVDDVYMTACQMATQKGCGWPLNAFALPDGRPVWAGTYFPKKEWVKVLEYFMDLWKNDRQKLEEYATQLTDGIQSVDMVEINKEAANFNQEGLEKINEDFLGVLDFKKGGRKTAPKFPMPNNWEFLMRYHHAYGNDKDFEAVAATLDNMANGGIYDQLGGGFARYSVDADWIVPHFEKMLYDNGQLVSLYSKAYQMTKNPLYKKVVEETLEFIERELTSPEKGFYSSLDADSEGEEGKFYVWKQHEIDSLLGDEKKASVYSDYFECKEKGNWEEEKNILYRRKSVAEIASNHGISEEEVNQIVEASNKVLFEARKQRVRPGLDDKVLTSWNALMLKGYVDAFKAFGTPAYLETALANGNFLVDKMLQADNRLNRNYKDGNSVINAFLDDYALTIQAFISLYEVTFDESWLEKADGLAKYAIEHFSNEETSMFFYTSDIDPALIARKMEVADNVIPGSNSSMARSLFYLGTFYYNQDYMNRAKQMMNNVTEQVQNGQPHFYSNWCQLYLEFVKPPYEVAIVGDLSTEKRNELMQNYLPNAILLGGKTEGSLELLKGKLVEDETMIYVCQNRVCKFPVTEVDKALDLIQ